MSSTGSYFLPQQYSDPLADAIRQTCWFSCGLVQIVWEVQIHLWTRPQWERAKNTSWFMWQMTFYHHVLQTVFVFHENPPSSIDLWNSFQKMMNLIQSFRGTYGCVWDWLTAGASLKWRLGELQFLAPGGVFFLFLSPSEEALQRYSQ